MFGLSNETYSCVGSFSRFFSLSGKFPLLTKNVVNFLLVNSPIKLSILGYNVGSPAKDIAALFGFWDSLSFLGSDLGFPKKPHKRSRCFSI